MTTHVRSYMYKIFYHKGFHDAFVSLSLFFDFSVRVNSKINKKEV